MNKVKLICFINLLFTFELYLLSLFSKVFTNCSCWKWPEKHAICCHEFVIQWVFHLLSWDCDQMSLSSALICFWSCDPVICYYHFWIRWACHLLSHVCDHVILSSAIMILWSVEPIICCHEFVTRWAYCLLSWVCNCNKRFCPLLSWFVIRQVSYLLSLVWYQIGLAVCYLLSWVW